MSAPEDDFREFRVTPESMRRVGGKRVTTRKRQDGGSAPSYSEMGAPVSTIGDMSAAMKDAAVHGGSAYAQTAQGVTPMTASGTLTSQIIQPIAMGQDPVGAAASVARAQAPMAGGAATVQLRAPKTRVLLRGPRKGAAAARKAEPVVGGGAKPIKTRKIGLAVKAMSKKLKKARKTAKKVASMSIETIKAALSKAGVLKGGSKAPVEMLRKMYKDLRTMRSGL
jgi:hypothetical protein